MASRLNAVRVEIADLLLATSEVHKLLPKDRDWKGRLHLMVRLFRGQPDKGLAVEYRIYGPAPSQPYQREVSGVRHPGE